MKYHSKKKYAKANLKKFNFLNFKKKSVKFRGKSVVAIKQHVSIVLRDIFQGPFQLRSQDELGIPTGILQLCTDQ